MSNNTQRIGIIGGGPGGLTLARILQKHGFSVQVLERDAHALERPQGGSLDIHPDTGQQALEAAGLMREFAALARDEDQYGAAYDHLGNLAFTHEGFTQEARPETDRTQLRQILLDSLAPGTVRWGCKVTEVRPGQAAGEHQVCGPDGVLGTFDLVVGADGAWSKVRPLVSSEKPAFSGVYALEMTIDHVDQAHPVVAAWIPRGKVSAVEPRGGIIAQRSSGGHVRLYLMWRTTEAALHDGLVDMSSPEAARAGIKALLSGWSPRLLQVIDATSGPITPRPIVVLPTGHRWAHRPGVTLLGDAAHVMSPFSGQGVNLAMFDAQQLALALTSGEPWDQAIAGYEERMFQRAAAAASGANAAAATWPAQTVELLEEARRARKVDGPRLLPHELFAQRLLPTTQSPAAQASIAAALRFELRGAQGGSWLLDYRPARPDAQVNPDCVVTMDDGDFVEMMSGAYSLRMAFITGKLKLDGDMMVAMRFAQFLKASAAA